MYYFFSYIFIRGLAPQYPIVIAIIFFYTIIVIQPGWKVAGIRCMGAEEE